MEQGILVPDEIVSLVIEKNINRDRFILDGYPRNLSQAQNLDFILGKNRNPLGNAVYLEVNESTVLARLTGRRVCPQCGANYHVKNMPPKKEGVCDLCSHPLSIRQDDVPEVITKRWQVFITENNPLLDYYREKGNLITTDANGNAGDVLEEIIKKLGNGK